VHQLRAILQATLERLGTAAPGWVLAVFGLYVASLFIVGARWRGFLRMLGADVSTTRAALATLGGIAIGNLTPSSRLAGEACRITLASLDREVTWRQIAVATVWDRLSEVPPVAVLCVIAAFALGRVAVARRWIVVAVACVAVIGILVRRLRRRNSEHGTLLGWVRRLSIDRCDPGIFAAGVGWSSLLWIQDVLRLMCAALAFGVALPPTRLAALAVLAMIGGLVPTLGGLGAVEGGLMAGLVAFGVEVPTAAAITTVERVVSYGFSTAAGVLVVTLLGGRSLLRAMWRRNPESSSPAGDAQMQSRTSGA
jgi:uncharacterized membrane protein YbhN (UPF0104 family)